MSPLSSTPCSIEIFRPLGAYSFPSHPREGHRLHPTGKVTNNYTATALSTTSKSESQNNSERLSSNSTSTTACSDCPEHFCTVPSIPANSAFQCPSLTRTNVPLRASYGSKIDASPDRKSV